MYVLAPNGAVEKFPYSIGQLRKDNPQTSFRRNPSEALLASYHVYPVVSTTVPYNPDTQVATQEGCVYSAENQRWETAWVVRDLTAEELQQRTEEQARSVRSQRDVLLQKSDWIVIKAYERNENIPSEWEVYRQALRDIPAQAGFPQNVTWPVKP